MKKTLLIVEDNLILCDILERWLQKAGYRVLTAIDEPSARRKIKGNNVALVLTDVRLPEGDGISLLEWSISQGLHIPFVVMTNMPPLQMRCVPSNWVRKTTCPSLSTRSC